MTSLNFRKINIEPYKPGISVLKKNKKFIKLSANESALGMSRKVLKILKSKNCKISKYPDSKAVDLRKSISSKFKCNFNKIICGSGSDEVIQMICQLFLKPGDEVIVPQYSFLMYRIYASIVGAKIALIYDRQKVIKIIGLSTFLTAFFTAFCLKGPLILVIALLWLYSMAIMLDSGALTAGSVESSDQDNRGAVLAVHSMIGFLGGAMGAPVIGLCLDVFGSKNSADAWFFAILCMGLGSLAVFSIQSLVQIKTPLTKNKSSH